MKKISALTTICFLSAAGAAYAGGGYFTIKSLGSETQTRGYAGLAWTLGAKTSSLRPQLLLGAQSLKVRSDNNVCNGVDFNLRFSFTDGLTFDSTRLGYVAGTRDALGNVGIGYSQASQSFLASMSAQGAYSRAGLDYELSTHTAIPFFEALSIGKPKKVNPVITAPVC